MRLDIKEMVSKAVKDKRLGVPSIWLSESDLDSSEIERVLELRDKVIVIEDRIDREVDYAL